MSNQQEAVAVNTTSSAQSRVITTGDWFVTMLITMIPIVNIIMLLVWAFGSSPESKKNWAKAGLIWMLVIIVLYMILGAALLSAM